MPTTHGLRLSEQQIVFIYLLTATLLLTGIAGWVLYRAYDFPAANTAYVSSKILDRQRLFTQQKDYLPMLDSARTAIAEYQPELIASYRAADIEDQIGDLRRVYTAHDSMLFFRAFEQAADFYQMMYTDKKDLSRQEFNAQLLAKQVDDCAVGFQPAGTSSPTLPAPLPSAQR